ncbi:UNVERIFIED_CONTAM: hypothetical protein Sindi_0912400 [Sesamum indicum]
MVCAHCHKLGHLRETCFQLYGVPEWYKSLNDKKKQVGGTYDFSGNVGTTTRTGGANVAATKSDSNSDVAKLVTEILKLIKSKELPSDPISNCVNYAQTEDQFAGNYSDSSTLNVERWIIDTGATNHVCGNLSCLDSYSVPPHASFIHLPDGSKKRVACIGTVRLSDKLMLNSVFFIPKFSVNLLSMSQLCNEGSYIFCFNQFGCILQDQATKAIVERGKLNKKLYIMEGSVSKSLTSSVIYFPKFSSATTECNNMLWHRRLGHASITTIKYIPECKISSDSLNL